MKESKNKRIRMIILILQVILYVLVSSGAICVIIIKRLNFFEGVQIFWPIEIGAIAGIIINVLGKEK